MFKRRVEDSGRSSMFQFSFKIFFVHIVNIIVMFIVGMLITNLDYFGIEVSGQALSIIISAVCMILYIAMAYVEGWRRGERDYNLVLYKHMEYNRFRGLIAGALSQLPGIILAIVIIFPKTDLALEHYARYFYVNFNYLFLVLDAGKEAGTVSAFVYHLCYFLPALIAPLVVGLAYHLGYRRLRIVDKLVWSKPKASKKDNPR